MKQTIFYTILAVLLMTACGTKSQQVSAVSNTYTEEQNLPGDSTLYGFACEGCTDSILVLLPFSGGDPDTIDILQARLNHQVFGRPDIGDQVAVILNDADSTMADKVINLDRLKGEWCYKVIPRLRHLTTSSADSANGFPVNLPDSLRRKWLQPIEYGFELLRDHEARSIGQQRHGTQKRQAPVDLPVLKRYRQWHVFNGHLLLTVARRDTLGNLQVVSTDTADIMLLRRDSLHLQFSDGQEQGYYRRKTANSL